MCNHILFFILVIFISMKISVVIANLLVGSIVSMSAQAQDVYLSAYKKFSGSSGDVESISFSEDSKIIGITDKKGNVLPEARIVSKNITAKELANLIHKELGKGFLYAIDARSKQRIGAEHILKNNDIIKIVSTTSRN